MHQRAAIEKNIVCKSKVERFVLGVVFGQSDFMTACQYTIHKSGSKK